MSESSEKALEKIIACHDKPLSVLPRDLPDCKRKDELLEIVYKELFALRSLSQNAIRLSDNEAAKKWVSKFISLVSASLKHCDEKERRTLLDTLISFTRYHAVNEFLNDDPTLRTQVDACLAKGNPGY